MAGLTGPDLVPPSGEIGLAPSDWFSNGNTIKSCKYEYKCVYVCMCVLVCMHACMFVHTHVHVYVCVHRHIHLLLLVGVCEHGGW